jgi:hypothetical protein
MFQPVFWRVPPLLALALAFVTAAPALMTDKAAGSAMPPRAAGADTTATAQRPDSAVKAAERPPVDPDSIPDPVPDSAWRWPANPRAIGCNGDPETMAQCWRGSPDGALMETGFPGIRARALNLHSLEPARAEAFYQAALDQSPYGTGGHRPFEAYEADGPRGVNAEAWAPVQPLDTPVTDLHWMRGALLMNQFGLRLQRMAGNRAYAGFDYYSNGSEKQFYDYAFNVHQPYLSGGRDSLSLVIEDTSHSISSRHVRPRLGFWLGRATVAEAYADWLSNSSSLANPTNPGENDSVQLLYRGSFSAATYGGTIAHAADDHLLRFSFRHAGWERLLAPHGPLGDTVPVEDAAGILDAVDAEWTLRSLPGAPRLAIRAENTVQDGALWTEGAYGENGAGALAATEGARGDRETAVLDAHPDWGWLALDLRGEGTRRMRQDGEEERLGGGEGEARLRLPWGFRFSGGAGWSREGAPEENLFRWQPALSLYPSPDLAPRTHAHHGAGAGWESRHLGLGAEWERNVFRNNWLPRILPQPGVCALLDDSLAYPGESAACAGEALPDSLALALVNYREETRDLLHLSLFLALGNWKLSLRNTYLLANAIRDDRLGFDAQNWRLPQNVFKGQLLWRRRVLDGRLGLQTRWDWEWFSERYVFASDMDGTSRVVPLDEYLALDFTAQMEIKTFLFYFRAMNLYHDRYATDPGVHPPGVNFRFGVDWRMRN